MIRSIYMLNWRVFRMLAVFCCVLLLPFSAQAQKGKGNKRNTKPQKTVKMADVQSLLDAYRFSEAEAELQSQLKDAASLEPNEVSTKQAQMKAAIKGMDMLSAAARVTFVDSVVVHRNELAKVYKLSQDMGTLSFLPYSYVNSLEDLRLTHEKCDTIKMQKMWLSRKMGGGWTEKKLLNGTEMSDNASDVQAFPFMMPDGATLYFAAVTEEGMGGYDIYVTRYNRETDCFLKPENIGMPFNSPANDYLYVVDEVSNIGLFATDRRQHPDSVCVYAFIPTESRERIETANQQSYINQAKLNSIAETQTDMQAVTAAKERLRSIRHDTPKSKQEEPVEFVITDDIVYKSLKEFKSPNARRIATEWKNKMEELRMTTKELEMLRSSRQSPRSRLVKLEQITLRLSQSVKKLAVNMRKAELGIK